MAPGSLVRFRCMVRDILNTEYYLGAYCEELPDGTRHFRSGMFSDTIRLRNPEAEVSHDDPNSVMMDRLPL